MKNPTLTTLLIIILISGCASPQERLARRQEYCATNYGYQYGSDAMAQCVERRARDSNANAQKLARCSAYTFGSVAYNNCIYGR
jgi:hypothetical protein